MPKTLFVVRAEIPDAAKRAPFEHWYATDHLPWAVRAFGARRGWRCWSVTDPAVHYAFYEFDSREAAERGTAPAVTQPLVADFDRVWPGISRRREMLEIAQEQAGEG
jgi:hypothetical protein